MAQVINTNISSINAQRNLNKSQSMMSTAMERLASGLRINSAKDDAAGLAISTRFDTQIRGLNQAVRNANDGISLAQTAEASMAEMTNTLQRMRELAVQAANSTNSDADRASIQSEIDQLYSELDRIAEETSFNGTSVLNGGAEDLTFQIGANSGQTLSFSIDAVTTRDLNLNASSGLGELNGGRVSTLGLAMTLGDMEINGIAMATTGALTSAGAIETYINAQSGQTGVTADSYNTVTGLGGVSGVTTGALTINADTVAASGSMSELVENINRDAAGVSAILNADGSITLSNDTGNNIDVGGTVTNTGLTVDNYGGYVGLTSTDGEAIDLGLGSAGAAADINVLGFNVSTGSDNVSGGVVASTALSSGSDITINGVSVGSSDSESAADKAAAINAVSGESGVEADAYSVATFSDLDFSNTVFNDDDIQINGVDVDLRDMSNTDAVVTAINNTAGLQGVVASTNGSGELVLESEGGLNIQVSMSAGARSFFGTTDMGSTGGISEARLNLTTIASTAAAFFAPPTSQVVMFSLQSTAAAQRLTIELGGTQVMLAGFYSQTGLAVSTASTTMTAADIAEFLDGQSVIGGGTQISAFMSAGQLIIREAGGGTAAITVQIGFDSLTAAHNVFTDLSAGDRSVFQDNAASLRGSASLMSANTTRGSLDLTSSDGTDIIIDGTAADVTQLGFTSQGGSEDATGIGLSVTSLANASNSIERIDDALDQISTVRAGLGAVQNRLGTTISNLETVSQNLAAANSRIKDADFAAETAQMTKAQILQQAGISILAQANAGSQSVLSLLG
ncbi:MAG: hypothetical protein KUG82_19065 [Pseudomonadales bacterium]|nr:hypothetical protein [Pseudomonadales bacterium]